MLAAIAAFIDDEAGLTSVEYAILLGLSVAVAVGALNALVNPDPAVQTAHAPTPPQADAISDIY